jgi:hypothetical protein
MPVVEGTREAQVRLVEHAPQVRLDRDADPRRREAPGEVDAEPNDGDRDDRRQVDDEPRAIAGVDRVVDRLRDQHRDRQRERREDERAGESEQRQAPLRPPEREQIPQGRPEAEVGRVDGGQRRS